MTRKDLVRLILRRRQLGRSMDSVVAASYKSERVKLIRLEYMRQELDKLLAQVRQGIVEEQNVSTETRNPAGAAC